MEINSSSDMPVSFLYSSNLCICSRSSPEIGLKSIQVLTVDFKVPRKFVFAKQAVVNLPDNFPEFMKDYFINDKLIS